MGSFIHMGIVYGILSKTLEAECNQAEGELKLTNDPESLKVISTRIETLNKFALQVMRSLEIATFTENQLSH